MAAPESANLRQGSMHFGSVTGLLASHLRPSLQLPESRLDVAKGSPRIAENGFADSNDDVSAIVDGDGQLVRIALGVELQAVPNSGVFISAEAVPSRDRCYQFVKQFQPLSMLARHSTPRYYPMRSPVPS